MATTALRGEVLRESRHLQIVEILERVGQAIEITDTQYEAAKKHYEAVGAWLAESDNPSLRDALVYAQGSVSLHTTVRPLEREEYDVDLVCQIPAFPVTGLPSDLKALVGGRLHEHQHYRTILEEKPRCWRLTYAGQFHLDVTPSIPNLAGLSGGELVADSRARCWKPSNPKGYRAWFGEQARRVLVVSGARPMHLEQRADVEALPARLRLAGVLRRTVQLSKRHRDLSFRGKATNIAPISIIITTLLARSYAYCAATSTYDTEYDALLEVMRQMPLHIERVGRNGRVQYAVPNPTAPAENFAEKWNSDPALAEAFFVWHDSLVRDFSELQEVLGIDALGKSLGAAVGETTARRVMEERVQALCLARQNRTLSVVPGIGLAAGTASRGVSVKPNTFFGA